MLLYADYQLIKKSQHCVLTSITRSESFSSNAIFDFRLHLVTGILLNQGRSVVVGRDLDQLCLVYLTK